MNVVTTSARVVRLNHIILDTHVSNTRRKRAKRSADSVEQASELGWLLAVKELARMKHVDAVRISTLVDMDAMAMVLSKLIPLACMKSALQRMRI